VKSLPLPEAPAPDPASDEAAFRERAAFVIEFLESVRERRALLSQLDGEQCNRLLRAAGEVARPDPWAKRELLRAAKRRRLSERRDADERVLANTGIRQQRAQQVFVTPTHRKVPVLAGADIDATLADQHGAPASAQRDAADRPQPARVAKERACYVCKARFTTLHFFYDSMCAACGDLNFRKRTQTADLSGRVALITGSRVKIGYQAAIMLLRAGAHVIVTTRFARDAAARYAREPDFAQWGERLQVHGLDLRHTPSVEALCRHLCSTLPRLDFILNNACQTVRRPPGFYRHLMQAEAQPFGSLSSQAQRLLESHEQIRSSAPRAALFAGADPTTGIERVRALAHDELSGIVEAAGLSQIPLLAQDADEHPALFPEGQLDADLQQVDRRDRNSWRLSLAEVPTLELLEVQLVNAVAPFVLNARLKPLMLRHASADKHIVNVSAMEGQFYRSFKTDKHPHTNMAKAALNMLTRPSARDYVKDGIHMNSVDTGWVTDEDVYAIAARKTRDQGFHPPLDIVDGAARICDPIFTGFTTGKHAWGLFFKDYAATDW